MKKGLFWFTNDLRLHDNQSLQKLLAQCDEVAFVYVIDNTWFEPINYQHKAIGLLRWRFICESLLDLTRQLALQGHTLYLIEGDQVNMLRDLIRLNGINVVAASEAIGFYERMAVELIKDYTELTVAEFQWLSAWDGQLFSEEQLGIKAKDLRSFSNFRKQVEKKQDKGLLAPETPIQIDVSTKQPFEMQVGAYPMLGASLDGLLKRYFNDQEIERYTQDTNKLERFTGGQTSAETHSHNYFSEDFASSYKETRNALEGMHYSTKFSPYLAQGNVSPRFIWQRLRQYEADNGANESTYWIGFELLWREYFHWLALERGAKNFTFKGSAKSSPLTSYYPERFQKWCSGSTPYPLVNACMRQLNATGFMSNRGRQIVASCLVNELSIDWRYGAAYFQQQLVDHDVASNWGNWQYIAGVGADPRGGRHFNIEKQAEQYDPDEAFVLKWGGKVAAQPLDSVDAADWPVVGD